MSLELSIIIPTYNASEIIKESLESILIQTFKNFEIVIIDGGSTDNTLEIINQYANLINIQFLSENDEGIYDAMNKGLKIAKGEWVYFLGSDDRLFDKNVLSSIKNHFNENTDIVYGNSVWVPENKEEKGLCGHLRLLTYSINHQRIFYRKSLFEKYGLYNITYELAADHERNIRFFCAPELTKKYVDLPISYYFSGGYSANKIDENFWNDWKVILLQNFKSHLSKKEIYGRIAWFCWYNIQERKYAKALNLFFHIYLNTFSFQFLKHTLSQVKVAANNKF